MVPGTETAIKKLKKQNMKCFLLTCNFSLSIWVCGQFTCDKKMWHWNELMRT